MHSKNIDFTNHHPLLFSVNLQCCFSLTECNNSILLFLFLYRRCNERIESLSQVKHLLLLIGRRYRLPHRRGESASFDRLQIWIPIGPHIPSLQHSPVTLILVCKSRCKFRNNIPISHQSATFPLMVYLHLLRSSSNNNHHSTRTVPHSSGSKMVTIPTMAPRQINSLRQCNRLLITKHIRPILRHLHRPQKSGSTMTPNGQERVRRAVDSR